jgi:hypothetical protein
MDKLREYLKDPKIVGIAALVIGILFGWLVIGWGLWPVQWADADLGHLREDLQERTMRQVIDAYAMNGDAEDAITSWAGFGDQAIEVYERVKTSGEIPEEHTAYFEQLLTAQNLPFPTVESGITEGGETGQNDITEEEVTSGEEEAIVLPTEEPAVKKSTSLLGLLLGVLLVVFLAGAAALAYFFFFRGRKPQAPARQRAGASQVSQPRAAGEMETDEEFDTFETTDGIVYDDDSFVSSSGQHLRQFVTEYVYGNDLYDDTFSIDAASGEFLGECGVGISDTLGSGEPKNVTAFEVWLFDKNDVQTVTKVLMTEYAMNNPGILQRLEVKGEPVQIRPDTIIELETATLKLEARILDVTYGHGGQDDRSFIQQMQVELTITSREMLG